MTTQPTGYQTSRDYARLAELMKTRTIVCFVKYSRIRSHVAQTMVSRTIGEGYQLEIGSFDCCFASNSNETDFITRCAELNLEWIVPDDLREPVKTVDEALNEVAKDLPADWQVVIIGENGWGGVSAIDPNGITWDMDDGIHSIGEQINNAVALAKAEENRPGGVPEIYRCLSCGKNAPEHGMICDECRMDSMND
jgi:hypothetical protein